jgi:hypothetical protein
MLRTKSNFPTVCQETTADPAIPQRDLAGFSRLFPAQ